MLLLGDSTAIVLADAVSFVPCCTSSDRLGGFLGAALRGLRAWRSGRSREGWAEEREKGEERVKRRRGQERQ